MSAWTATERNSCAVLMSWRWTCCDRCARSWMSRWPKISTRINSSVRPNPAVSTCCNHGDHRVKRTGYSAVRRVLCPVTMVITESKDWPSQGNRLPEDAHKPAALEEWSWGHFVWSFRVHVGLDGQQFPSISSASRFAVGFSKYACRLLVFGQRVLWWILNAPFFSDKMSPS